MFKWFKKLKLIVKNYNTDYQEHRDLIQAIHNRTNNAELNILNAEKVIRDRASIHADIHYKSPHQVIIAGRYNGKDYVQMYGVTSEYFDYLINQLKQEEKYGHMERIDAPLQMKAVFEHEFWK